MQEEEEGEEEEEEEEEEEAEEDQQQMGDERRLAPSSTGCASRCRAVAATVVKPSIADGTWVAISACAAQQGSSAPRARLAQSSFREYAAKAKQTRTTRRWRRRV